MSVVTYKGHRLTPQHILKAMLLFDAQRTDYRTWLAEFSTQIPIAPFEVAQGGGHSEGKLPGGRHVEQTDKGWVVRDERGAYWCGLVENGWTDTPDEDTPALTFQTSAKAAAAFAQADQMYSERAARNDAALSRLGHGE